MSSLVLFIWLFIVGIVVWVIVQVVSRISGSHDKPASEMAVAYSKADFLRQTLWLVAASLLVIWCRAVAIWLGLEVDWYWFWVCVGCLAILTGFLKKAPLLFLGGIALVFVGTIQAGFELVYPYSRQDTQPVVYVLVVLIPVGLLAGMKSASLWLEEYPKAKRYSLILEVLSLVGLLIVPLIYGALSSRGLWAGLREEGDLALTGSVWAILLLIFTAKDFVIGLALKAWKAGVEFTDLVVPALWAIVYGSFVFMPGIERVSRSRYYGNTTSAFPTEMIAPAVIMNGVFLATISWLLYEGVKNKQIWKLNVSILALFVFVIQRYFDWFQNTFLDRSLFFIVLGVIFLGAGFLLEKLRGRLIDEVTEEHHEE